MTPVRLARVEMVIVLVEHERRRWSRLQGQEGGAAGPRPLHVVIADYGAWICAGPEMSLLPRPQPRRMAWIVSARARHRLALRRWLLDRGRRAAAVDADNLVRDVGHRAAAAHYRAPERPALMQPSASGAALYCGMGFVEVARYRNWSCVPEKSYR